MIDASGLDVDLEVDGGIGAVTIVGAAAAGANVLIAGSGLFAPRRPGARRQRPPRAGRGRHRHSRFTDPGRLSGCPTSRSTSRSRGATTATAGAGRSTPPSPATAWRARPPSPKAWSTPRPHRITSICVDDYHKFDRIERKTKPFTPLHPDCNYVDIMEQHLQLLALGNPILKPVYNHKDGTLGRPVLVEPRGVRDHRGPVRRCSPSWPAPASTCRSTSTRPSPSATSGRSSVTPRSGATPSRRCATTSRSASRSRRPTSGPSGRRPTSSCSSTASPAEDPTSLSASLLLRPTIPHPDLANILTDEHRSAMHLKLTRDEDGKPVDSLHIHFMPTGRSPATSSRRSGKHLGSTTQSPGPRRHRRERP